MVVQHRSVFKAMSLDVLAHELAWEEEAKMYNEDRIRVTIKEDGWYKFRVAAVTSDATGRMTRSRWDEHAQVLVLQKGNLGKLNLKIYIPKKYSNILYDKKKSCNYNFVTRSDQ